MRMDCFQCGTLAQTSQCRRCRYEIAIYVRDYGKHKELGVNLPDVTDAAKYNTLYLEEEKFMAAKEVN